MQIVLGAGLAGLSLAVAFVREGVREPIVVIDRRETFGRDRTWCTWADPQTQFLDLACARWPAWEVVTAAGRARATSHARPYVCVTSDAFYAAALAELETAPNVELRLGESVLEIGDGWARTDRGRLDGRIHDGLALGSPALRGRAAGSVELWQSFLGWEVETEAPAFDPGLATLMDFRIPQDGMVQFLYTLPFSSTRALVEHTTFGAGSPTPDARRAELRRRLPDGHRVVLEERGRLPMTTARLPAVRSSRTTAIGIGGGALRASSGYAFSRVQAHSAAIARAVARGEEPPARAGLRRRAALDAVFLHALAADPAAFPERFRRLVERVAGDAFARFMTDTSTPADELAVMRALPTLPFARAAGHALVAQVHRVRSPSASSSNVSRTNSTAGRENSR